MHVREITALAMALITIMAPLSTVAQDKTSSPALREVDTFGKLLAKQAELFESDIDTKIKANQASSRSKSADAGPALPSPLPEVKQEVNDKEPIVEAIWGLAGKEVAEVIYQGRRVAVSMQEPFISRLDGWKLQSINSYEILLVKNINGKETARKSISLSWGQGNGNTASNDRTANSGLMPQRAVSNY